MDFSATILTTYQSAFQKCLVSYTEIVNLHVPCQLPNWVGLICPHESTWIAKCLGPSGTGCIQAQIYSAAFEYGTPTACGYSHACYYQPGHGKS